MIIVALNCGSSSLKFALYRAGDQGDLTRLGAGEVERIGDRPMISAQVEGADPEDEHPLDESGHGAAVGAVFRWIEESANLQQGGRPDLVGHRVVHGGARYREATVLDDEVLDAIEEAGELARLHNAPALAAIRAAMRATGPATPHVAVFDTAFHRDMPSRASRYAIPHELAELHHIERFGFHGIAHAHMADAAAAALSAPREELRLITLQLGNGCSAAAIEGGRSVDTTMGLTPLEGLMMGTRSGDVDPALPAWLGRIEGASGDEIGEWLNARSGLLGVSGRSADVRDLLAAETDGDERATLALEMFCYRVRKQIGAYLAALEGADAIVFGGGIGEHQPDVRRRICEPLEALGVWLDASRNASAGASVERISRSGSPIAVYVVPVDEQYGIAADALAAIGQR